MDKIKDFQDLRVWQQAHDLVLMIYRITKDFPKHEMYGLASQMQRSAVSVTSNIAEGFGRYSAAEKVRFYNVAGASLTELQNQLIIAKDVEYVVRDIFAEIYERSIKVHMMNNKLIKVTKNRISTRSSNF